MTHILVIFFLSTTFMLSNEIKAEVPHKAHAPVTVEAANVSQFPVDLKERLEKEIAAKKPKSGTAKFFYLFGVENEKNSADQSHTFANFVSIDSKGIQKWHSISWLPLGYREKRELDVFKNFGEALKAEIFDEHAPAVDGENFELADTLQFAREAGLKLGVWGPLEITDEFFELGERRSKFLAPQDLKDPKKNITPSVQYKAVDKKSRRFGEAFNCMRAVSDLAGYDFKMGSGGPLFSEWGIWGFKGTQAVLDHLAKKREQWFVSNPKLAKPRTSF